MVQNVSHESYWLYVTSQPYSNISYHTVASNTHAPAWRQQAPKFTTAIARYTPTQKIYQALTVPSIHTDMQTLCMFTAAYTKYIINRYDTTRQRQLAIYDRNHVPFQVNLQSCLPVQGTQLNYITKTDIQPFTQTAYITPQPPSHTWQTDAWCTAQRGSFLIAASTRSRTRALFSRARDTRVHTQKADLPSGPTSE